MSATILVRLHLHQVGNSHSSATVTGFISPSDNLWGLKDNVTKLLRHDLFGVSKHQPLPLKNMDPEKHLSFFVDWSCLTGSGSEYTPTSMVGAGDVKELMEAMKNRGWKDVLGVKVMFDPEVNSGLKTMDEGERAWAPISARVDEELRLAKLKFAEDHATEQSD